MCKVRKMNPYKRQEGEHMLGFYLRYLTIFDKHKFSVNTLFEQRMRMLETNEQLVNFNCVAKRNQVLEPLDEKKKSNCT